LACSPNRASRRLVLEGAQHPGEPLARHLLHHGVHEAIELLRPELDDLLGAIAEQRREPQREVGPHRRERVALRDGQPARLLGQLALELVGERRDGLSPEQPAVALERVDHPERDHRVVHALHQAVDQLGGLVEELHEPGTIIAEPLEHPHELALLLLRALARHLGGHVGHHDEQLGELRGPTHRLELQRERGAVHLDAGGELLERQLDRQRVLEQRLVGELEPGRRIGGAAPEHRGEPLARRDRAEPAIDGRRALGPHPSAPVEREEPLVGAVEHRLHVGVALVERGRARLYQPVEPNDVVEEAAGDEHGRHGLQHHEQRVHEHHPHRRGVVEHARRDEQVEQQVMQRHRDGGGHDRERVGRHREQREQHEEVKVHLDLHRALAKVDERRAHRHRGHAEHERHVARVVQRPGSEPRTGGDHRPDDQRLADAGAAQPGHEHEHGRMGRERERPDPVDPADVVPLEGGDLRGEHEVVQSGLEHGRHLDHGRRRRRPGGREPGVCEG
jgi:hypothetical protein